MLKSQQNPTQSRSACRSIAGLCIFLLGLFGIASSSAASEPPAQAASGSSSPPAPAAQSAALIDLGKIPIGADDSGTYWATFDPVPLNQTPPSGALPPSPIVIPEPDKTDKANGNGEDKKDEGLKIEEDERKLLPPGWNLHAQTTLIQNFDPGIRALYSGPNSLSTQRDREGSISADLFLGAPLWQGAEFHFDLLMWQGFGLSDSFGLEAFPNGDAYKAGSETPRFMAAHLFVRQTIGLGGEQQDVPDGQYTLPGKQDVSRLTITVGRLNMAELFDNVIYNTDPHTQFMSWANTLLTWDYPADTIGFTTGFAIDLNQPNWALRYGWFQLPSIPNGFTSDDRILMWPVEPGEITSDGNFWKQWGMILEFERRWRFGDHPGSVLLSAWIDHGLLADYNAATTLLVRSPPPANTPAGVEVTVPQAAFSYRSKYGFGVDWQQEVAKNVGTFARFGWQDGETAAAVFTDVDWTVQLGVSVKGAAWHRPNDTFGLLGNIAGASSDQVAFLKAGGTGILNGDGNLGYTPEMSLETYYDIALAKGCNLAFDYQFFGNPAFNADRGPVNVFATRLHWEF
ncbi:MAG TPA: carbohydrate porin [Planctomycetaceae bacterium]|nr:carbohydrate porin [Planctomycetaceae bacterium]